MFYYLTGLFSEVTPILEIGKSGIAAFLLDLSHTFPPSTKYLTTSTNFPLPREKASSQPKPLQRESTRTTQRPTRSRDAHYLHHHSRFFLPPFRAPAHKKALTFCEPRPKNTKRVSLPLYGPPRRIKQNSRRRKQRRTHWELCWGAAPMDSQTLHSPAGGKTNPTAFSSQPGARSWAAAACLEAGGRTWSRKST